MPIKVGDKAPDFELPSTIFDLPFLSEKAKRNILGENALRLFKLERPPGK